MTSPVAAVLSDPGYRRLFISGLFVNVARWVDLVTLGWLALQLTGSPFLVGLAAFARTAPLMVVGPFTGIVADRVSRARMLVVAQSVAAATALLLALVFGSGLGGYGVLVACEVVLGLTWTLDLPRPSRSRPCRCRSPRSWVRSWPARAWPGSARRRASP
jgi:MFS family permease